MIKTEPMRICGTMHGYPCFQHHTTPLGGPLTRSAASSVALSSFATSLRTVKTIRKRISEHPNHPTSDLLHRPWMSQSVAKLLRYVRTRSHARTHQLKPATRPPALWMMSATHRGPSPRERSSQIVCSANAVIVIVVHRRASASTAVALGTKRNPPEPRVSGRVMFSNIAFTAVPVIPARVPHGRQTSA